MADNRSDDDIYSGKTLVTEMYKIERTESRGERRGMTGVEVLAADHEEKVGLAVECAFEKFVEKGSRITQLYGGTFCVVRAPKFYV